MEPLRTTPLRVSTGLAPLHDSQPDGPDEAVVFVHGNPGPMDDFEVLIPAVAGVARVVAIDMPGFGRAVDVELAAVRKRACGWQDGPASERWTHLFTTFGPDTLTELRQAWAAADGGAHVDPVAQRNRDR